MRSINPKALLAGVTLTVAFLAGIAFAPSLISPAAAQLFNGPAGQAVENHGPGGGPADYLSTAATYIGISAADLRTALSAGKSLADVATEHGKTRDGLIAALTQAEQQRIAQLVDQKGLPMGPGGPGRGPGHFGFHAGGDPFAAAATYLDISEADLRTKVQGGTSLAAIANSTSGKNRDGLIQALVGDATAKVDQAQKDGKLTADQATRIKSELTDRMTRLVDATASVRLGR